MNEIVNTFLLRRDRLMPKMHLRQPGFTQSACGQFAKNKERIQTFKETGDSRYIHQNELNKSYFQLDMAYGDFKDLTRRTASDKILCNKAFNIAKNPKFDGYERGLASMIYNFFLIKNLLAAVLKMRICQSSNLSEESHKPIIRKFEKRKVQPPFIDNIWGADLADMRLISKFTKGFRFLLCVIDIH